MKIKMVDLQKQYLRIKEEVDIAIENVLSSTAFIQGPEVLDFAKALGRYVGSDGVVTVANGTDALQICMMALGLKPGDEVIVPVHTYVATAEVIALLGLTPLFIDVDPDSFNIDTRQLRAKISNKTKAIVPVHLYGQCADMEPILNIAAEHGLFVIEDAAQALGAQYIFANGETRMAGTMGTMGTTSFFPSKNLGCFGDGGAIFSNDLALCDHVKMIANHGQQVKYQHDVIGVNSRLDTLQAAILLVKLHYLDQYAASRTAVADFYDKELANVSGVRTPYRMKNSTHVFNQYTLRVENRDALKSYLASQSIPTMIYYPIPLHLQKAYNQSGYGEGSFPVTEDLSKTVISLPIHTEMKQEELQFICDTIKAFYNG